MRLAASPTMRIIGQIVQTAKGCRGARTGRATPRERNDRDRPASRTCRRCRGPRGALGRATILALACAATAFPTGGTHGVAEAGGRQTDPRVAGLDDPEPAHGPGRPDDHAAPALPDKPEGPGLPPVPYALDAVPPFPPAADAAAPAAAANLTYGAVREHAHATTRDAATAVAAYADRLARTEARRVVAAKQWGLRRTPLLPPPPPEPADLPRLRTEPGLLSGPGLPPVITRIPTDDKVVFLTIDDGSEKDPELLRMLRELQIPVTGFLSDHVAGDDYDYFRRAARDGADMHNHSISHHEMTRLDYATQREEICEQQDILERELGERPTLFRPPYGAYDRDTLRAAAECGVEVVPLWTAEAFPDRIEWGRADRKLHPGDIILTHFRGEGEWDHGGDMVDVVRRVVDLATRQGFAVARLADYLR